MKHNVTLWEGDPDDNYWGIYLGLEEVIEFWIDINLCTSNEDIQLNNLKITKHRYFDCNDNAEVWLYEVVGGGHDWPGSYGNMDINASEEIWSFFSQYTFNIGDINNDGSIDVLDVIATVNLVFNGEYNMIVDMNYDGIINVLDIVDIIYIILN